MSKTNAEKALRFIPRVDDMMEIFSDAKIEREYLKRVISKALASAREELKKGSLEDVSDDGLEERVLEFARSKISEALERLEMGSLRRVINGTGVLIHTNLGRAVYDCSGIEGFTSHYSNLEFDLLTGERGSRNVHLSELMNVLTGAEASIVVNNNAAAVMLVLAALSSEREVIVSRGEQVEIGGSFRIPEVAELSGAILKEIGTTNKTRISDYEKAVSERTGMILRVEPSNYMLVGQVGRASNAEIYELSQKVGLPYYIDLGSGVFDEELLNGIVSPEDAARKQVGNALQNADIISFSGDKLLGSVQAGVIVGNKKYIEKLARHPLYRAVRPDKMTLFTLSRACTDILRGRDSMLNLMMKKDKQNIAEEVMSFMGRLASQKGAKELESTRVEMQNRLLINICDCDSSLGGGTVASSHIPSKGIEITGFKRSETAFANYLRNRRVPIVPMIESERISLDFRTLLPGDVDEIILALNEYVNK